ncbi:MAG: response regulator [bacterium]
MILIVEDDPDTRHAIGEYLSTLFPAARVVISESGETALALAERIAPQVVLLDLRLGGMQGFEFAERLRRHTRAADTAIVALTADTSPDTLLRAEEAGFAAFLRKPADLDRLESVLRPLLSRA